MVRASFARTATSNAGEGSGTGIVFAEGGYIVTNAHVVQGASRVSAAVAGSTRERPAQVIGVSACDDLAVLRALDSDDLPPALLGKSRALKVGETVVALGYPLGDEIGTDLSVRQGIISKLGFSLGRRQSLIQTDAAINPGDSGGPLINQRGEVIGINTSGFDAHVATNVNFAVSMDYVKDVIADLKPGHNRLWMGMRLAKNNYADYYGTKQGVVVDIVETNSPADRIGVQMADLLLTVEGTAVDSVDDVCKLLRSHEDGDRLEIEVLRRTKTERQQLAGELVLGDGAASARLGSLKIARQSPLARTFDFKVDAGGWYTGTVEGLRAEIKDGFYNLSLTAPKRSFVVSTDVVGQGADTAIATSVLLRGQLRAGLALRYRKGGGDHSYYACWIDSANQYGCFVYANGTRTNLAGPAVSDRIVAGQANLIAMAIIGNEVSFLIDDVEVARFKDSRLASGSPGLYLENFETEAGALYDSIAIRS